MSHEPGLVIVGLGAAGTAAAKAFREQNSESTITIITNESLRCYSRPRLPEIIAGTIEPEKISIYPERWYEERAIKLITNQTVVEINTGDKQITTNEGVQINYHRLILATGADVRFPTINGLPSPFVYGLRTMQDALLLKEASSFKQHALLIGGGLLGLEVGYALTQLGLKVIVIEIEPRLLPRQLDDEGAALLQQKLMTLGFEFFVGAKVGQISSTNNQVHLTLASGLELTADLATVSTGIEPRVFLAKQSGLAVGPKGIIVDDHLQTSNQDIYAVGDCAQWRGCNTGLWMAAQAMGRIGGLNAADQEELYAGVVPSTKLKVAGIDVSSQGNINPEGADIISKRHDGENDLIKLYIRDGYLAGVIQVGYAKGAMQYKKIIEKKYSIKGFEQVLLEKDVDFKQLPGFQ